MADHVIHHHDRESSHTGTIIAAILIIALAILAVIYFWGPGFSTTRSTDVEIDVPANVTPPTPEAPKIPTPDVNP